MTMRNGSVRRYLGRSGRATAGVLLAAGLVLGGCGDGEDDGEDDSPGIEQQEDQGDDQQQDDEQDQGDDD